jgi:uncharacterized membrane protein YeaQ/YmgE (transglycosylase-associated protein family)
MQWYWWLLAAAVGLIIGWLAGMPYKKDINRVISKLIINLILGTVGGLLGAFLYLLMRTLLLTQIIGVIIMSAVGAIILLWLLARVKKAEDTEKHKTPEKIEFVGEKE